MRKLFALMVLTSATAVGILPALAADTTPPAGAGKTGNPARTGLANRIQFKGPVQAVDAKAQTVTVSNLVISITTETRIQRTAKPSTFADIKVGEEVRGSYLTSPDGKLKAFSLFLGAKPGAEPKPKEAPPKEAPKKSEPAPKS